MKTGMLEKASSPKHQGKRYTKRCFDAAKESIDQRRNTAIDLARYELETRLKFRQCEEYRLLDALL
jgi:hypothetical protein